MSEGRIQKFLYFAYGSNLLSHRILLQNPTAVRKGIGKLNDYRLDFGGFAKAWGGHAATIVPDPKKHVWGAVWEIEKSQMKNLDDQEGVSSQIYVPMQVKVIAPNDEELDCRVYKMVIDDPEPYQLASLLPKERRPSRAYLETILQGAIESNLPDEYFLFLKSFPHNGFSDLPKFKNFTINFTLTEP